MHSEVWPGITAFVAFGDATALLHVVFAVLAQIFRLVRMRVPIHRFGIMIGSVLTG